MAEAILEHQYEVLKSIVEIGSSLRLHMDTHSLAKRVVDSACTVLHFRRTTLSLSDGNGYFRIQAIGGELPAQEETYLRQHPIPDKVMQQFLRPGYCLGNSYFLSAQASVWQNPSLASFFIFTEHRPAPIFSESEPQVQTQNFSEGAATIESIDMPQVSKAAVASCYNPIDMLLVPLVSGKGAMLGFLSAATPLDGFYPSLETATLLELFANQVAVVIEGIQLYEEAKCISEERAALIEIGRVLSAPYTQRDLPSVYRTMYQQIKRVIPTDAFWVQRYEHVTDRWHMDYLIDEEIEYPCDEEMPFFPELKRILLDDTAGRMFLTNKDYVAYKVLHAKDIDDTINGRPSESLLFVPIYYGTEPLGIISAQSYSTYAYSPHHFEMLQEIGRQAALAMTNAQLNSELHRALEEAQQANARLEAMANCDPLTDLPNHRSLLNRLIQELGHAIHTGHSLSVAFFDGDHFKQVNDTYGHQVGDQVLRELGSRASSVLRTTDTLGRYGGEEFLVILPETDTLQASAIAERLCKAVSLSPLATSYVEKGIPVTISVGIASFPLHGQGHEEIVDLADQAMYWAKRLGRNQVRTAEEALRFRDDKSLAGTIAQLTRQKEEITHIAS